MEVGFAKCPKKFLGSIMLKIGIQGNDESTTNDPPAKWCKLYHDDEGYIDDEEYA